MPTGKWADGTASALTLSSVNSLANNGHSGLMTYDNSTAKAQYGKVAIVLGSITTVAGAYVLLRVYTCLDSTVPDDAAAVGGGEIYPVYITAGTGIKTMVIPFVRLYGESMRFQISNVSGSALAASGNSITIKPSNDGSA